MKPFSKSENQNIANHIFSGSTTMIGVSITIISFFKILKVNKETIIDEFLGINTLFFIVSCLLSYITLRNPNMEKTERYADIFFFLGLSGIFIIGLVLLFLEI
ncbi:MAG TPA: hypothetical protein PKO18_02575 [Chitinophagales bacterium]|jgi:FtsH-binding integral membrane protein|nr:hypothetical protein [Chitinophagales bacterium]HNL84093.1 hypothetical protein [Chitinophagales bacterium]